MDFCFVCGCERDKNGSKTIPLCDTLRGHPICFISHQIFNVLNNGRPDKCPTGSDWSIDWKLSMKKYVKPQVAAQVEKVITLLESNGLQVLNQPEKVSVVLMRINQQFLERFQIDGISQRLLEAFKQGSIAVIDLLSL